MIKPGDRRFFIYPNYGTPDGYPDYTAHSGQQVQVRRRLAPNESDFEMYEVEAADGWRGHAHADELRRNPPARFHASSLKGVLKEVLPKLKKCDCHNLPTPCLRCLVQHHIRKLP